MSRYITFDGETHDVNGWAKKLGISSCTLSYRLKHWPIIEAITTPKIPKTAFRPPSGLKHGMYATPEYKSWQGMLNRCRNKKHKAWHNYGGRGIKVCKRWHDFSNFYADMGSRPKGLMLDRIDNNKGYEPSNCRWASFSEQQKNKRQTLHIEYDGRKLCLTDWAKELGFNPKTLMCRYHLGQRPPRLFRPSQKYVRRSQ